MTAAQMLDERMKAALRQSIADATARGQKARVKFLTARLAEVEAASK